jgi:hypothetical protein
MGLKRGPLSVVRIIEKLFERKVAASVWKTRLRPWGSTAHTTRHPLYPLNLALTSPTSRCRSVGIVQSRIKATELLVIMYSHRFTMMYLLEHCQNLKSVPSEEYVIHSELISWITDTPKYVCTDCTK